MRAEVNKVNCCCEDWAYVTKMSNWGFSSGSVLGISKKGLNETGGHHL